MMDFYKRSFEELELIKENNLLWVYLNSPTTRNALSITMIENLIEVLNYADADKEVRVIILGARGKAFCSGGDIKSMINKSGMFEGESNELRLRYQRGIQKIPRTIEALETPIVSMVDGAAVGAGMDLSCMTDFRICSNKAKFSGSFSKLGLVPGDGGTYFLARIVGYSKALEIYLLGEFFSSSKALDYGMITKLVEDGDKLEEVVRGFCLKLSANAPIAISLTKKALKAASKESLDDQLDRLSTYQGIAQRTEDHFEGVKALLEKRNPKFLSE